MAATSNSKILLKIREEKKQRQINHCCSICGKKLKKFKRGASENPLSCWWCMILNNADS
jgi:hypothetical protein